VACHRGAAARRAAAQVWTQGRAPFPVSASAHSAPRLVTPTCRFFFLTPDCSELRWESPKKTAELSHGEQLKLKRPAPHASRSPTVRMPPRRGPSHPCLCRALVRRHPAVAAVPLPHLRRLSSPLFPSHPRSIARHGLQDATGVPNLEGGPVVPGRRTSAPRPPCRVSQHAHHAGQRPERHLAAETRVGRSHGGLFRVGTGHCPRRAAPHSPPRVAPHRAPLPGPHRDVEPGV
jgi:hypothetical protein